MADQSKKLLQWVRIIPVDHPELGELLVLIKLGYNDSGNELIEIETRCEVLEPGNYMLLYEKIEIPNQELGLDIIASFSDIAAINFIERNAINENLLNQA